MASKQVRWECPNGCPAVLGPRRPKSDNVCRFCLTCSAKSKRALVRRTAPAVEKARVQRRQQHVDKLAEKRAQKREREIAYYTVNGVNMLDKMVEFTRLQVFKDDASPERIPIYIYTPRLRIRRCSSKPRSRYGFCRYSGLSRARAHISVSTWPGQTLASFLETLLHEVVHAHVGRTRGRHARGGCHHGPKFKSILRQASEQAFGVRPRLENRFHGEITRLVEQAAAEANTSFEREVDGPPVIVNTVFKEVGP